MDQMQNIERDRVIAEQKKHLRRTINKQLLAIESHSRQEKSKKACANLIETDVFQNAATVMMFLSLPHEIDTSEAILKAWQQDKVVVVPKISWQQRHMIPVRIDSLETEFDTEVAGLRNPVTGTPVPFADIDLVITPALAFDSAGNRLGRGGSYYDRFFAHADLQADRCGFVFHEQVLDTIPFTTGDEPVDMIVTDRKVIHCSNKKDNRL